MSIESSINRISCLILSYFNYDREEVRILHLYKKLLKRERILLYLEDKNEERSSDEEYDAD